MEIDDLDEEIPTWVVDEYCFKDIKDEYDQLYVQFLKQEEKLVSLRGQVNSSEEETRALQVDLVKSKTQICGLEDERKTLNDQ
ncbi:unnamed protein product, partial [Ilex paraguariensis]